MNILSVTLVYGGLITVSLACISIIRPIKALRIRTRRRAILILVAGVAVMIVGVVLPQRETRVPGLRTRLDEFAPVYQFSERHSVRVEASREQVWAAIRGVTPEEIALFDALTWLRRLGRAGPKSIINAPPEEPLLDTATRTGFIALAEDPGKEIVIGVVMGPGALAWRVRTPEQFKAMQARRVVKIAMNFRIEPDGPGAWRVFTETRVYTAGMPERQAFAVYWRIIYPGSAMIRRMWLRGIRRRAEVRVTPALSL